MQNKKIEVSIIIVNYKVEEELIVCIYSILKSKPKVSYEIIVIDNDEKKTIEKGLKNKFTQVKYIKSQRNLGYSGGNNLGAKYAKGDFFFFLNPDTIVFPQAIDKLFKFLQKEKEVGIVAPLLLDISNKPYQQGSKELGVLQGIVVLSFLNKLFPNNPISRKYLLASWNKKNLQEVDVVPGTAFMIRKDVFGKIGKFDEQFFLFFEEFDLCKRVRELGYKLFILPQALVKHIWGASTKKSSINIKNIFKQSRFYYFKKHYGLVSAFLVELFASVSKINLLVILVLAIGAFLRLYNIENLMPFIGDQGWFYLSARDMLINGNIPLVGIASSHPWLHQGPLWTYALAGVFWLFGFSPINGAYLTIALGILSVLLMYTVGSEIFSKRAGLISAMLYATSPLVIIHSRTPYHTSPIPLFTLLFIFSLYKWIKGNSRFFPLSIFFLTVLYNLELATVILWFILLSVFLYGLQKNKEWIKKLFNKKIFIYSFLAFLIPMIPIAIYDFSHNFPQTLKFIIWIGYRILKFFGFPSVHGENNLVTLSSMFSFLFQFYQSLLFAASNIVALTILVFSFSMLTIYLYKLLFKKINNVGFVLLLLWILVSLVGYFINKTSSEAYLPIFFPALIFLVAFSFDKVMKVRMLVIPSVLLICILSAVNSYFIISSKYFTYNGLSFSNRLSIAKEIVKKANGRSYNLSGVGNGSQFESFTMNYEYLTWWLGHSPTKFSQELKYIIQEDKNGVILVIPYE